MWSARSVCVLLVSTLLLSPVPVVADYYTASGIDTLNAYYTYLRSQDTSIFSGSVFTQDTTGKLYSSSVTFGSSNFTANLPMSESTSFRINTLSESFVVAGLLRLVNSANTNPVLSLNDAVPQDFLPRKIRTTRFRNANFLDVSITLQMLMQHTSTLNDAGFDAAATSVADGPVTSLQAFCESYFTTNTTGGGEVTTPASIWNGNSEPGLTSSYQYASANVALMAFILEQAVLTTSSPSSSAAGYIQEQIFNVLGMTTSFLLQPSGARPRTTFPAGGSVFDYGTVQDLSSATVSDFSQTLIHPAYAANYMYYSSSADLAKWTRSLFLPQSGSSTRFSSLGVSMRQSTITVSSIANRMTGVTRQGLGLMFFDGSVFCSVAYDESKQLSIAANGACVLRSTSTVYGSISRGRQALVGWFCTTQVSSTNPTCVVAQLSYFDIGTAGASKSHKLLLGLAMAGFQTALFSQSFNVVVPEETSPPIYGFYVFIGVAGAFFFVMTASYMAEHLIQPAPIVAAVPPHSLPIPSSYYGHGDGGMMGNIAPPTMRGDFYDQ